MAVTDKIKYSLFVNQAQMVTFLVGQINKQAGQKAFQ
jgi:hypothetical protein